jgi:Tfp pilus assembly protein PilX
MSHHSKTPLPRPFSLRREDGISLILVLGVMLVASMLMVAAFTSANGEIHSTASDTAQKKAYYAAEAGIENYEYHLTQDGDYLSYCTKPTPANTALNQYYKEGTTEVLKASELTTAEVPEAEGEGGHSQERYALQLIPAESDKEANKKCNPANLVESMVEEKEGPAAGTFRVASTGFSGKETRTLVATFRNANFVSYVWYSVYETADPGVYGNVPTGEPSTYWTACGQFYTVRPARCRKFNNYFISGETVDGPMHTEDHVGICGHPVFGRSHIDRIEFGNGGLKSEKTGYSGEGCSEANPTFNGTYVPPAETLQITPPPGDEELLHIVETPYLFSGKTEIYFKGETMTISHFKFNATTKQTEVTTEPNVAFPANGVIYVQSEGSCPLYQPFGPLPGYSEDDDCGNVYVQGEYSKAVTIASQDDVIIDGNLYPSSVAGKLGNEPTGSAMLGLIANNFVRVYHPVAETYLRGSGKCKEETYEGLKIPDLEVKGSSPAECEYTNEAHPIKSGSEYEVDDACDAPNASGDLKNPYIYAAILALNHAFIVDNFNCGEASLGNLNVYGAIAGDFSNGMTGQFSGSGIIHGYPYNLKYDNRLQVEEPPHFLNPLEAAWYIQRQTLAEK